MRCTAGRKATLIMWLWLDYVLQTGGLFFFFIEDWRMVSDYRHIQEVTSIYAEPSGRRLVIVDTKGDGYLYNPVSLGSSAFV